MKKTLLILAILLLPTFILAKGEFWEIERHKGQKIKANGLISDDSPLTLKFIDSLGEDHQFNVSSVPRPSGPIKVGGFVTFELDFDNKKVTKIISLSGSPDSNSKLGVGSQSGFTSKLFPGTYCSGTATLDCWLRKAFEWAGVILASASVIAIMAGGIMYMTSAGNTDQVGKAKKIIFNALAGVAILVLAKFFMSNILGAPWSL